MICNTMTLMWLHYDEYNAWRNPLSLLWSICCVLFAIGFQALLLSIDGDDYVEIMNVKKFDSGAKDSTFLYILLVLLHSEYSDHFSTFVTLSNNF